MGSRELLNSKEESFERQVFNALKHYKCELPESEEEIDNYIKMFGKTKVELPESSKNAGFLFDKLSSVKSINSSNNYIIGMAARGDKPEQLPEHLIAKIKDDIEKEKWLK